MRPLIGAGLVPDMNSMSEDSTVGVVLSRQASPCDPWLGFACARASRYAEA